MASTIYSSVLLVVVWAMSNMSLEPIESITLFLVGRMYFDQHTTKTND